jgi:hypothetical protein
VQAYMQEQPTERSLSHDLFPRPLRLLLEYGLAVEVSRKPARPPGCDDIDLRYADGLGTIGCGASYSGGAGAYIFHHLSTDREVRADPPRKFPSKRIDVDVRRLLKRFRRARRRGATTS